MPVFQLPETRLLMIILIHSWQDFINPEAEFVFLYQFLQGIYLSWFYAFNFYTKKKNAWLSKVWWHITASTAIKQRTKYFYVFHFFHLRDYKYRYINFQGKKGFLQYKFIYFWIYFTILAWYNKIIVSLSTFMLNF